MTEVLHASANIKLLRQQIFKHILDRTRLATYKCTAIIVYIFRSKSILSLCIKMMHTAIFFIKLFVIFYKENTKINLETSFIAITFYTYNEGGTMNKVILPDGIPTYIIQKAKP